MYGWRETEEIVNTYAERYANERGITVDEWLSSHEDAANTFMANAIKDVKVTLERNQPCFCGAGKKFKKCHLKHK